MPFTWTAIPLRSNAAGEDCVKKLRIEQDFKELSWNKI
jgi:hypothetical protein